MIKKILLLCLLMLLLLLGCNKKSWHSKEAATNDSINKYLELAGNDTLDVIKRLDYNDKALALVDLSKNDSLMKRSLYMIYYYYYDLHNFNKVYTTTNQLIQHSLKVKDDSSLAFGYRLLGMYYMSKSYNDKALEYLFKAKKIFQLRNDLNSELSILEIIAMVQSYASDFLGSNKTLFDILKRQNKANIDKHTCFCYAHIATNLSFLKQNIEAIEYFKKAKKVSFSLSEKNNLNNNIAISYIALKDYKQATYYLNLNLKNNKIVTSDPSGYATAISNIGLIMIKENDLRKLPKTLLTAEKIFSKANSLSGRNYNQKYLSMYYEKVNDTEQAISHAKEAVELSRSYKNPDDVLTCLQQLIKVDKRNAFLNAQEYIRLNDSMQVAERQFRDKFARIAYETDEIAAEKDKAIHQKWIVTGLSLVILLIVILLFIISRQRTKQKELQLLQEQQKANEQIYYLMLTQKAKEEEVRQVEKKRIALELHDGIMNKLASTRLNLSVLSHQSDQETITKCVNYIKDIYQIEQEIRTVSHELNHEIFKQDSFIKLLEDFIKAQNDTNKTRYVLELDPDIQWDSIPVKLKMHLYRIVQEASQNITKHAQAKNAILTFTIDEPNICMSITDDGIGFDSTIKSKGIGIQNMKRRVKSLNGKFRITSVAQKSTTITIAVPI